MKTIEGNALCGIRVAFAVVAACAFANAMAAESVVKASQFGWNGEDDTAALQKALDSGAKKVVIDRQKGDWVTRPLFVKKPNFEIVLEDGVTVRAKKGEYHNIVDSLIKIGKGADNVTLRGDNFSLTMSHSDGSVTSYIVGGRELLARPLRWNFWRPPTENDLVDRNGARAWQGLDNLQATVMSDSVNRRGKGAEVLMNMVLRAPGGQTMRLKQLVEVNADGRMQISCLVSPDGHFRTLPKIGLQFGLDTMFTGCTFYGNIHETYPDRRTARRVSRWYKSLAELAAPQYVVPQEQGNREARWVRFNGRSQSGDGDIHLTVISPQGQDGLNFSVRRWNDSTLTAARRWCGLAPDPYYTVSIDHLQAGLGTATCGPGVDKRHTISGDSTYSYRFIFDPVLLSDGTPFEGFGEHPSMQAMPKAVDEGLLAATAIVANREPAQQYSAGFPRLLSDGRRAVPGDYTSGWAGFDSPDTVELVLMLADEGRLTSVTASTCHSPNDWVLAPLTVEAQFSSDGHHWSKPQELTHSEDISPTTTTHVAYTLALKNKKAHYVRLRFICSERLPVWHPHAGQPSWLMIDEITVR